MLLASFEVRVINPSLINKDIENLPPDTTHNVIEFKTYSGSFFSKTICFSIQMAKVNEPHQLTFYESLDACESVIQAKKILFKDSFYNMNIQYEELSMKIKYDKKLINIPFYNFKAHEEKLFASHKSKNKYGSFEISVGLGGKKTDLIKEGDICYQLDEDCNVSVDNCEKCPVGTYYIKNSKCSRALTKVCGIDRCGEKGQAACVRGKIASGIEDYCIQDSPYGFCANDLRVACVNNKLICE